eukprot:CAMPEP_0178432210 /NCGR_PEP_ID=MMETSP0689_2-20121128/32264_1 /TAXON_ID=160604 /ORGANISM="Amphidinium massartii, Strain CS-259" /LENGTH=170 /DNA_ID=CAMNT_0020054183 /DNA_START=107 /DNA_END=617 /DNA_ORIENTATION=+
MELANDANQLFPKSAAVQQRHAGKPPSRASQAFGQVGKRMWRTQSWLLRTSTCSLRHVLPPEQTHPQSKSAKMTQQMSLAPPAQSNLRIHQLLTITNCELVSGQQQRLWHANSASLSFEPHSSSMCWDFILHGVGTAATAASLHGLCAAAPARLKPPLRLHPAAVPACEC